MTTNPTRIHETRCALPADLDRIRQLLASAGLPFEDVDTKRIETFLVVERNGELLATGGVELHGSDGLLRSVVVNETARGSGLGVAITRELETRAQAVGIAALYLLTTTAAAFFPRLGYERFERDAVPEAISRSTEFASLCPAGAACFRKTLG